MDKCHERSLGEPKPVKMHPSPEPDILAKVLHWILHQLYRGWRQPVTHENYILLFHRAVILLGQLQIW